MVQIDNRKVFERGIEIRRSRQGVYLYHEVPPDCILGAKDVASGKAVDLRPKGTIKTKEAVLEYEVRISQEQR